MRLVALMVVAAAAPAAAAPCAVEVVRAPDGVREVIDHYVAAEPQCAASLEVRIVETDEGLYVVAQDREGRVRDRVVPDARAAGVVIASWAADESVAFSHAPAPIIATAKPETSDEIGEEARVERTPARRPWSEHQWIRFGRIGGIGGAMLSVSTNMGERSISNGARGSVGVWTRGAWTIDASFDFVDDLPLALAYGDGNGLLSVREYNAIASLGYVLRTGRWSVTPALGLGLRRATLLYVADPFDSMYPFGVDHTGFFVVAQASALAAVDFADRVQLTVQVTSMLHSDPWQMRENLELVWIAGLGVAL